MNLFKVKRIMGLILTGIMPAGMFFFFLLFGYNIIISIAILVFIVVLCIIVFNLLTRHPLMSLIEGEGLLALTFDSTGVIEPFIVKVNPPFIKGRLKSGKDVASLFDRQTILYTKNPRPATLVYNGSETKSDGKYESHILTYKKGEEGKITFAFQQYPTLIYNKNLGTFLTKDSLAKIETEGIIKHLVLYLKMKVEELTSIMRDFARYVVEMTKPKSNWLAGRGMLIFWIIFGIGIVALVILFAPQIMNILGPAINTGKQALGSAAQTGAGTVQTIGS